ncbi:MFS efflux pump atnC [Colletotrichum spaethianum]|uniref:MFS efflux pump atnC n=1 Tax=Colletotrichum spaethianum TaxID=700344 RepID=A0AA37P6Y2_9PEZI|nr:MFS efflux pump atnC [Colletotrichum spaethianum]GKT41044.1 MFS efflux pump atnC [Colletotrichum spaethianum]
MSRLSDEVEADHLLSTYSDHEGVLPTEDDPESPASFHAFSRPAAAKKWRRPSVHGWSGPFQAIGDGLRAGFSRLDAVLAPFRAHSPRTVILMLALLKFALTCKGTLLMMPLMRLIEDGICHKHYHLGPAETIPEMKCKADEVQTDLAWLGGWQSLIGAVVNMIVAFPYGVLSDRIGRKAGMLLAYLGTVFAFSWSPLILAHFPELNIYFLFFGSAFFLIGGGIVVVFNNIYAMAADVSTENDRASNFVFLSVGSVLGGLLGPVTGGFLMERYGPWVPVRLVFVLTPFVFLIIMLLPETLRGKADGSPRRHLSLGNAVREALDNGLHELRESVAILKNRNILLCLMPSLIQGPLMTAQMHTLPQYISKNFGWTLAQTSYLLSPLGVGHLGILLILPWISKIIMDPRGRFRRTGFGKDALLTKASYIMIASSALIEALSREIVVFLIGLVVGTFGSASGPLARAMITEFVAPEHTSRLYALASMVDTLGSPLGGPVLAWAFSVGLEKKGGWKGLPWFYVSLLAMIAWAALMLVREPRKKGPIRLDSEDGVEGLDYESGAEDEL